MQINFNTYKISNNYSQNPCGAQPLSFGSAKTRKFLETVSSAKYVKHINATFDDMVDAYNDLGYDVVLKRGSHAIVPLAEGKNLPLVIPHGRKFVSPLDIKRLQLVVNGDIDRAITIH